MSFVWKSWHGNEVADKARDRVADVLNEVAADGVTHAQSHAPRDTGFLANTIEVTKEATKSKLSVEWGNITALYTLWQEIGSRGRSGKYFLRGSLDAVKGHVLSRLKGGKL